MVARRLAQAVGDGVELGDALQADQSLLHVAAGTQDAAVPVGHLAEAQTAETLAAVRRQQMEVASHELQTPTIGRGGAGVAGPLPAVELAEEPRVEQGAAADGDAVAAG